MTKLEQHIYLLPAIIMIVVCMFVGSTIVASFLGTLGGATSVWLKRELGL